MVGCDKMNRLTEASMRYCLVQDNISQKVVVRANKMRIENYRNWQSHEV